MARKSNKTAHVLNLIAGHDSQQEATEESSKSSTEAGASSPAAPSAPAASPAAAPAANTTPQNISVIDTTTKDPVADLIQQQLTNQFDEENNKNTTEPAPQVPEPPQAQAVQPAEEIQPAPQPQAPASSQPAAQTEAAAAQPQPQVQEAQAAPQPQAQPEPVAQEEPAAVQPAPQPAPETPQPAPQPQPQPEPAPAPQPQPEPEPDPEIALEPDFARVNVMEAIVNDKIIYFMRQFDVCTCDRCVADTCALTLSGLLPKYIVTTPAAVDPLLSFYTNRYISDVTVEATKACMVVKDNPRH